MERVKYLVACGECEGRCLVAYRPKKNEPTIWGPCGWCDGKGFEIKFSLPFTGFIEATGAKAAGEVFVAEGQCVPYEEFIRMRDDKLEKALETTGPLIVDTHGKVLIAEPDITNEDTAELNSTK